MIIYSAKSNGDLSYTVNEGRADQVIVSKDPSRNDPNWPLLLAWFRSGNRAAPKSIPLERQKDLAIASLIARIDTITGKLKEGYSADEIASWPTKVADARAVLAGSPAGPLVQEEADRRGVSVQDMATLIDANGTKFETVVGAYAGLRGAVSAEIMAAADKASVETARVNGLAEAEATAAQMQIPGF